MAHMKHLSFFIGCLFTTFGWCESPTQDPYGWYEDGVLVPDTGSKGHDGPFLAHLMIIGDAERLYHDWTTKPENPDVKHMSTALPGAAIDTIVVFARCEADSDGNCQVWGIATVTASDGRTLVKDMAVPLYVGHPPLKDANLGISEHGLGMVVEDFNGSYRFEMLVEDRVAQRKVALVQDLTIRAPSN